ncbi:MAG: hypothetical protein QW400_02125 [Candidatus Diapherotrites archaeon]
MIFKIYDDSVVSVSPEQTTENVLVKEEKPKSKKKIFLFSVLVVIVILLALVYFVFLSSPPKVENKPQVSRTPEPTENQETPEKPPSLEETPTPIEKKSSVESISVSAEDSNGLIVRFKLLDSAGAEVVEDGVATVEVRNFFEKVLYTKTFYVGKHEFKGTSYELQINKSDINKSVDPRGYVLIEFTPEGGKKVSGRATYNKLEKTNNIKELLDIENYACEPESIEGIYSNTSTTGITVTVRFSKGTTFVATSGTLETKIYNSQGNAIFEDRREIKPKDFTFTNPYLGETISYYFNIRYSDVNLAIKSNQIISYEKCNLAISFVTAGGKTLQKEVAIQMPTK